LRAFGVSGDINYDLGAEIGEKSEEYAEHGQLGVALAFPPFDVEGGISLRVAYLDYDKLNG